MCSGTQWNDTLIFMCDSADGNVAQIRTGMLMCVRYAIAAGANLVIPRLINGDGNHEPGRTRLDWDRKHFDFMFDEQHFIESMKQSCPEMTLYRSRDEVRFTDNYVHPPVITVRAHEMATRAGEDWRAAFYNIVQHLIMPEEDTYPIIIEMARPSPNYDIHSDGSQFVHDFGNLLKVRGDVRALAHRAISKMNETYAFQINEEDPIIRNAFFGVHLYTEEDRLAPREGWPAVDWNFARYEPESKHYFDQAAQKGHRVIYAGSHRQDEVQRFTKDAQELNMKVHTKWDLLQGDDRKALDELTKDEHTLIDFLVLLKASDFAGIGHASLSWNVALKRHQFAVERDPVIGKRVFQDDLSHLYGRVDEGKKTTLYNNMWP
jgi:hypothetical protein